MSVRTFFVDQPRGLGGPLAVYGLSGHTRLVVPRPIISLPPTNPQTSVLDMFMQLLEVVTDDATPTGLTPSSRVREVSADQLRLILREHFSVLFGDAETEELTLAAHQRILREDAEFVRASN